MAQINVILALMIIICFLIAVVFHEYMHALTATLLGDPTPRGQGRQSFSLRAHLDPLGTLLCIVLAFLPVGTFPLGLGWGQPVKTDPWKLRGGPNVGTLLVSVAGILSSIALGLLVALLLRFLPSALYANVIALRVVQFIEVFAVANIALGLFNLLPFYPLDGYQIVYTLLPSRQALKCAKTAQYGPLIIIGILFVIPFLMSLARVDVPLLHLSYIIMQGAIGSVSLVSGQDFYGLFALYNIF